MEHEPKQSPTGAIVTAGVIGGGVAVAIIDWLVSTYLNEVASTPWFKLALTALPIVLVTAGITYYFMKPKSASLSSSTKELTPPRAGELPNLLHVETLHYLGITGSTSKLWGSVWTPKECMEHASRSLSFMGLLGSKWVHNPADRAHFSTYLQRMNATRGKFRFLLLDPLGDGYSRMAQLRGGAMADDAMAYWRELMRDNKSLQVRLYDQLPAFRLVFIDGQLLAVSRYNYDKDGYFKSKYGWDAPHLVIENHTPWTLYCAFDTYYDEMWELAKELECVEQVDA